VPQRTELVDKPRATTMPPSVAEIAKISSLLDQAMPLDIPARRRWIERLPSEHRKLATVLRHSLLPRQKDTTTIRLDTLPSIDAAPDDLPTVTGDRKAGERIGPYQLLHQVGSGGMAEVWLARRADGAFTREVALKVPTLSRSRLDLLHRFARERDILARMEHTNIARMYDAGVASTGLPYLAMEYVRGAPLIAWCDARQVALPERIRLFLQVLDAVEYVHDHRVVHRDLKPPNILVTKHGQVRLLDFGVATTLDAECTPPTQLTRVYGKALTPDYASPELLGGQTVGVATDVYSLGIVLYELLTGNRPYRTRAGASATRLALTIRTVRIQRPSARLAPDAGAARGTSQRLLAKVLSGDLDAIVLKALAISPRQRYASASALGDDLRRFLCGQPVQARPGRPAPWANSFLLHHRSAAGLAAVLLAAPGLLMIQRWGPLPPAGAPSHDERSIVVLPFTDMSERRDQAVLAAALAEEIRSLLSKAVRLRLTRRASSLYYRNKPSTIADISRDLNVAFVMEGSVRTSGGRMRITVELVRGSNGFQVWSQVYERDTDDLLKVQDDVANSVSQAVKATLLPRAGPEFAASGAVAGHIVLAQPGGGML
jgi:serine/threonine protein kinase/TolB-like protein